MTGWQDDRSIEGKKKRSTLNIQLPTINKTPTTRDRLPLSILLNVHR